MSKKFFSLIHGDTITAAPNTKILPAKSFSTLLDGEELLEHIKRDAEKYREEIIAECEQIKEQARKEGFEEGFNQWTEQVVLLEKEIENVHEELQKAVIPVALKAAKKMVGRELELSKDVILDIVSSTLKAASQHKKITIYVNRDDLEILEKNKSKIKDLFENLESLSIRDRSDIKPGGCVIETEVGIINAQLEHRWEIFEKAFQNLTKSVSIPKKTEKEKTEVERNT